MGSRDLPIDFSLFPLFGGDGVMEEIATCSSSRRLGLGACKHKAWSAQLRTFALRSSLGPCKPSRPSV